MKKCSLYNRCLPKDNFFKNGNKMHYHCKECFTLDIQKRQIEKKKEAIKYLGGTCQHCNIYNPIVLEFHHIIPKEKEASWGRMKGWSWPRLQPELDKCILLCTNCHVIEHATFYKKNNIKDNG